MNDKLIEPFAAPEVFVNGFCDYRVADGVMTCTGYRLQKIGEERVKVAAVRLVFPIHALEPAIASAREAQAELIVPELERVGRH